MNETEGERKAFHGRKWLVPSVLVVCVFIIGFWEIMANITRDPFCRFNLTEESFKGFSPSTNGWIFQSVPINSSPSEPNILAFTAIPTSNQHPYSHTLAQSNSPVHIRLVHGYNMPDCMRIKGYKVELIEDRRSELRRQKSDVSCWSELGVNGRIQIWRLTSCSGDVSIWVTSMIRASDLSPTDVDIRSMLFPRVGVPDEPGWFPRGFSWSSLKNPLSKLRLFMRAKWNASRCDIATFLRLKTPAWANNEYLTLVTAYTDTSVKLHEESQIITQVASVQMFMLSGLRFWSKSD